MTTSAIQAVGTLLGVEDSSSPGTYTTLAGVVSIQGPGVSRDVLDATELASTGGWREKIAGLKDGGDLTLELHYVPDNAAHGDAGDGLLATLAAGTVYNFQISWPDTSTTLWQFAALVSNFSPSASPDGKLTASVTLSISGAVDLSA